jgi:phospholipase/carboxylesterase
MRGRSTESGTQRWFRSFGPSIFDQKDIRFESGALNAFFDEARSAYRLEPDSFVALGYSNGANLLGAALLLHPGIIRRAVLLRPVMVLDSVPDADLAGTTILIVLGETDAFRAQGEKLADALRSKGADVTTRVLAGGHALGDSDAPAVSDWLAGL